MHHSRRSALLVTAGFLGLSLLSCGREVTGPENGILNGRARVGALAIDPQLPTLPTGDLASEVVPFERVRVVLRRTDGSVAKDTMVDFPSTADSVALAITLPLPLTAPDSGLTFGLLLKYINAAGDTVFAGGPSPVLVRPAGTPGASAPVVIPVAWVPPGGVLPAAVTIAPDSGTFVAGTTTPFSAVARDAQGNVLPGTPFAFISADTTRATVTIAGGVATWRPVRGAARIIASALNGTADTANVLITLPASRLLPVSGDAQAAVVNTALAQPLVLRVTASDSVPVAGRQVTFAVTTGGGTLSATADTSDANGLVSVNWTLGALVGAQSVTASVTGAAGATQVLTATALAQVPTQLAITSGPVGPQVVGVPLPDVTVEARDANGARVTSFTGQVRALVIGAVPDSAFATAVAGVATFSGAVFETAGTYHVRFTSGALAEAVSDTFVVSPAAAATLAAVSGDAQAGTVGTALAAPFVVRVTDAFGNAVAGTTVNWAIAAGGGTLSATSSASDANGLAGVTLTLPPATGGVTVNATAAGLTGSPVTFTATANAGAATQLVWRAGPSSLVAGVPGGSFIFEALDAQGNLATSYAGAVTLTLANGPVGATPTPGSVTAVNGVIEFLLAVDLADPDYVLIASAAGLASDTTDAFSVVAGAPTALTVTAGDAQGGTVSALLADSVTFRLVDAFGNPIAAAPIAVTVVQGGGTAAPAAGTTNANGEFRTAWTLGAALGAQLLRATVTSAPAVQAVASATAVAGAPSQLAITSGAVGPQVAGVALPTLVVEARDGAGNLAPTFTGTVRALALRGVGGQPADSAFATAVGGVATFTGFTLTQADSPYQVQFSAAGLGNTPLTTQFTVSPAAPATLIAVAGAPTSGTVGQPTALPFTVRVVDAFGNGNGATPVLWRLMSGADTLAGATVVTDGSGQAQWAPGLPPTVGTYTVLAIVDGLAGSPATWPVTADAAAPAALQMFTQPTNGTAGATLPSVAVRAVDGFGNLVPGFTGGTAPVTVAIASGPAGAVLGGATTLDAFAGVATFSTLSLDRAGTYTLRFTSAGLADAVSASFDVVAGAAAQLVLTSGPVGPQVVGVPLPDVTVEARDASGNRATSFTGQVRALVIGAVPDSAFATAVAGVATFSGAVFETAGTYHVRFTSGALAEAVSDTFVVSPGPAANLGAVSGDAQSGTVGTALAAPFVVRVTDAFDNAVAGTTVTWAIASGGGTLSVPSSVSDANGLASVTLTLPATAGAIAVTATAAGLTGSPVSFGATAVAGAAVQLVVTSAPAAAVAGVTFAPVFTVEARDALDNPVPTFTGPVTAALLLGGTLNGTTTVNAVAGVATFADLSTPLATVGQQLAASSPGLGTAVSAAFTVNDAGATGITAIAGTAQTGTVSTALADSVALRVTDTYGNPVSGAPMTVTVSTGGGAVSPATGTTNGAGEFRTQWTLGPAAGTQSIVAGVDGLPAVTIALTAQANPGAATQLALTSGPIGPQVAGVPLPDVTVEARDADGNRATSFTGQVRALVQITGQDSVFAAAVAGVATFSGAVFETAGTKVVRFSSGTLIEAVSDTFVVSPAAPASLLAVGGAPSAGTAGEPTALPFTVHVEDAFGNRNPSVPVLWRLLGGTDTLAAATVATDAGGQAQWVPTLPAVAGAYTVLAIVDGLAGSPVSYPVTAAPGAPTQVVITSGAIPNTQAGVTLPAVVIEVRDAGGNVAAAYNTPVWGFVLASPDGPYPDSVSAVTANGVAVFDFINFSRAGTYQLLFRAPGVGDVLANTFDILVGPAAFVFPDSIAPGGGQTGAVGQPLPLPLRAGVHDTEANPVSGVPVTFTAVRGADTLGVNVVNTDVEGIAAFTPTLPTTPGPVSFIVTSPGLTGSGFSLVATAEAGAATQLVVTQQPDTVAAGAPIGIVVVQARDLFGNPATSFGGSVTAEVLTGPPGATLGGTLSIPATGGEATFNTLTLDLAGDYTLQFTSGALGAGSANVTVVAGAPATVLVVGGNGQTGPINSTLPDSLAVRVTDAGGNPVAGVATNWAVTVGGGALSASVATTGTDGIARVAWTLGPVAGAQQVDLEVTGAGNATFTATGTTVSLTWAGTVSDAWTDPANWVEGRAPVASDSITIPDATFPFAPRITAGTFVRSLVNLSTSPLTVDGAVALQVTERLLARLDTVGVSCPTGALDIGAPGTSTALRGRVDCNLRVVGDNVALDGETRVGSGRGASTQLAGQLVVNGQRLTVEGGFYTFNTSRLVMTNPADTVTLDDASFQGGPTTGALTEGLLRVRGGLDVPSAPDAFAASGNHRTQFVAGIGDTASLGSGLGEVRFGAVEFARPVRLTGDFGTSGDVFVNYGGAVVGAAGRLAIDGSLVGTSGTLVAPRTIELAGVLADTGTFRPDTTIFDGVTTGAQTQVMPFRVGASAIPEYREVRIEGLARIALSGAVDSIAGSLVIRGDAALADIGAAGDLRIAGDLVVTGDGPTPRLVTNPILSSTNQPHQVTVHGDAVFDGGSAENALAQGTLVVHGDFSSLATLSPRSFSPALTYRVRLEGDGNVSFADPALSQFAILEVTASGVTRQFLTDVNVRTELRLAADGGATFASDVLGAGGTRVLTTSGLDQLGSHTFRNVALRVIGAPVNTTTTITFADFDPEVVQLEVARFGGQVTLFDPVFTTTPTGPGRYLRVVDTDLPDGDDLQVIVSGAPTPQFHGGFAEAVAPATLSGWFDQLAFNWTGAVNPDWANPGNWSANVVPTATDSVFIPGGLSTYPVIAAPTTVRALAMGAGATLAHNEILTVAGSVDLDAGASMGGDARLDLVGTGAQTVRGTFGTVRVNGGAYALSGVSQMGNLDVYDGDLAVGDFDLTLTGGLFTGPGGTFTMTGTATVDVAGFVNFFGNSTRGRLTNGILRVRGDFEQLTSGPGSMEDSAFVATGNHVVELAGTGDQVVRLESADSALTTTCATSCFATLRAVKPSGAVRFLTSVKALRDLDLQVPDSISAPTRHLVAGGALRLTSPTLTLGLVAWRDDLATSTSLLNAVDSVVAWGSDTLLRNIPGIRTHVAGSYRTRGQLDGSVTVTGTLDVDGAARIVGNLQTGPGGLLRMTDASDSLVVDSLATFGGASTDGFLTAGVLRVGNSFSAGTGGAFAASSGHRVQLFPNCALCGGYAVSLADTLSRFGSVVVEGGAWDIDSTAADVHVVDNLTVDAGATVRGGLSRLLRLGNNLNVVAGGWIDVGRLQLAGALDMFGTFTVDTLIRTGGDLFATDGNGGSFTYGSVRIAGPVRAVPDPANVIQVGGQLVVEGAGFFTVGSPIDTDSTRIQVAGPLRTSNLGVLAMESPLARITTGSDAIFNGGVTNGVLTAGLLEIGGNFSQDSTAQAFAASGSHVTRFQSEGTQTVSFANPATASSRFQHLEIAQAPGSALELLTNAWANGQLRELMSSTARVRANPSPPNGSGVRNLNVRGANLSGVRIDGVRLLLQDGAPIDSMVGVTIDSLPVTFGQLIVNRSAGAITFDGMTFAVPSTDPGNYLVFSGLNSGNNPTITMVNPFPASHGGRVSVTGGAQLIGWDSTATATFTGSLGSDWGTAANWSTGVVPDVETDVVIPPGQVAQLDAVRTIRRLTVAAGGTLTIPTGDTLVTRGDVDVQGLVATGVQNDSTSVLRMAPPSSVLFGSADTASLAAAGTIAARTLVSGGVVRLSDSVRVASSVPGVSNLRMGVRVTGGTLDLNGRAMAVEGAFETSGDGTLVMTNAADSLDVAETIRFGGGSTEGRLTAGVVTARAEFLQDLGISPTAFAATGSHLVRFVGDFVTVVEMVSGGPSGSRFARVALDKGVGRRVEFRNTPIEIAEIASLEGAVLVAATTVNVSGAVQAPGPNGRFDLASDGFIVLAGVNPATCDGLSFTVNFTPANFTPASCLPPPAVTWTGNAGTSDWNNTANWQAGALPTATDSVFVPAGVAFLPAIPAATTLRALVSLHASAIPVLGTITIDERLSTPRDVGGLGCSVGGVNFAATATPKTVAGRLDGCLVRLLGGTVTAVDSLNILNGDLQVEEGATFDVGSDYVEVGFNFSTLATGVLRMQSATGTLRINGGASFQGGSTEGQLTAGTLSVGGNFTQSAIASSSSFAPSGTHETVLSTEGTQQVFMETPGQVSTASHFHHLRISQAPASQVQLNSDVYVNGQLREDVAWQASIGSATFFTLYSGGADVSDVAFQNVRWEILDGDAITTLDAVAFGVMLDNVPQFGITRTSGSYSATNFSFATTPVTGSYLRLEDPDGLTNGALTLTMTGTSPTAHGGLVQVIAPAELLGWGANPPALVNSWTGGVNNSWSTTGNWSLGRLPISTDSVIINVTDTVNVTTAATVGWLTVGESSSPLFSIGTGATFSVDSLAVFGSTSTVTMTGGTLTGAGSVSILGALTWSGGTMSGAGSTAVLAGATASVAPSTGVTLNTRSLVIGGSVDLGAGTIGAANLPTISVLAGGTLQFTASRNYVVSTGEVQVVNAGTLRKAASAGLVIVEWPILNTGTLEVADDTLDVQGLLTHASGTLSILGNAALVARGETNASAAITIGTGGRLQLQSGGIGANAGNHIFGPTSSIAGSGWLRINSADTTRIQGALNIDSLTVQNGNTWFEGPDTMFVTNGSYLGGGFFRGTGVIGVRGSFELIPGNVVGTGTFSVRNAGALTFRGMTGWKIDVDNGGTAIWGDYDLTFGQDTLNGVPYSGMVIRNGGTWEIQHGAFSPRELFARGANAPQTSIVEVQPGGVIRKSSGSGVSNIRSRVLLSGLVDVLTGSVNVQGTCSVTGGTANGTLTGNCVIP